MPTRFCWTNYNSHSYIGPIRSQGYAALLCVRHAVLVTNDLGSALSSNAVLTITGPCLTACAEPGHRLAAGRRNLILVFPSVAGCSYIVESKDVLTATNPWLPLVTNAGTAGLVTNEFPITTDHPSRFYRLLIP